MIKFVLLNINAEYQPSSRVIQTHSHPEWQFDYIKKGEVYLNTSKTPLLIKEGEAAISPPNFVHGLQWIKKTNISSIHFYWPAAPDINFKKYYHIQKNALSKIILDNFLRYGQFADEASQKNAACCLHLLFSKYFKISRADNIQQNSIEEFVLKAIEENQYRPVMISELADKCGFSVNHFIRKFKEETGETPSKYILKLRIERAKDLIKHADLNLTNIARSLGFADLFTFSKAFKKISGISPNRLKSRKRISFSN